MDRPLIRQEGLGPLKEQLERWKPRPNSGQLHKDIIFLLLLVFVQTTLAPSLLGSMGHLDLLTPWLVITCVRQRALQATLLVLLGALALETRLAVPAGLYVCYYWIMANLIFQFRAALSWRYRTPWFVCYAIATLGLILFETFVVLFLYDSWKPNISLFFAWLLRLGFALGFGMMLASEWMRIDAEEPVPQ